MVTLTCMVVNDGSVVYTTMEDAKTVYALKQKIQEMKMYDFPADELTLFVSKTDKGKWMQFSDDDFKKLKQNPSPKLIQSILSKPEMEPSMPLTAFAFERSDAKQAGVLHVLVLVPTDRWEELRRAKKANADLYDPSIRFQLFTLDPASVLDPTTVAEGTLQCTQSLSNAFHDFGGFPAKMFVRKEMQMVWTILHDNYVGANPPNEHYALLGSFGVGKSALLHLFCCFLAVKHNYNILLARDVSRLSNTSCSTDAVLWFRGNHVTGYPDCDNRDMSNLWKHFKAEHKDTNNLIVCGDYPQARFDNSFDLCFTCDLLVTSHQCRLKSRDNRRKLQLLLPAWRQNHLRGLTEALAIGDFDERYAYSGGCLREFTLDLMELKRRRSSVLSRLRQERGIDMCGHFVTPNNSDLDWIELIYTSDVEEREGYLDGFKWKRFVDSSVIVKALASKWRLDTIRTTLGFAQSLKEEALHRQVFEVLVHKLAHERRLELDVRDSAGDLFTSSRVAITSEISVTLGNGDDDYNFLAEDQKWARCLEFLTSKATNDMYWYPGCHWCSGVDSVLIVDGVVHYVHVTVTSSLEINLEGRRLIHEAVLTNKAIQSRAFKCVVVTPGTTPWGKFEGMVSGIPGVAMSHAHVTHIFAR